MIWVSGPHKGCIDFNDHWLAFTGRRLEEELGSGWAEGVHPDDRAGCVAAYTEAFDARRPFTIEYRLRRADGEYRWVADRGIPRFASNGAFLGYIGSAVDVTASREAEARVRQARAELVMRERKARLEAEAALARERAARAEAEAANQAADRFLAMLGHELRNPLAPIVNALQVLDQVSAPTPEAQRLRQIIGRQTRHLTRLVDDLLDVARVRSGKVAIERKLVELRQVAQRVLESVQASGTGQLHEIALVLGPDPVVVAGDRVRLEQVVGNLVDNAIKYSPADGPIRVVVRREDGEAVLRVQDRGRGIAPEQLQRIFEPFAQLDAPLDRPRGGLGLGLTVVRGLVEQHGGTITASSTGPGQGAEFVIRLPLVPTAASAEADPGPRSAPRARRVVIVEDYADAREALEMLLTMDGHRVLTAPDGLRGVELILTSRPDLALVDIGLPAIDGYEVARRVRVHPAGRAVYLVALTGYGQPYDVDAARRAGFDVHLVKPLDSEKLGQVLARLGPAAERGDDPRGRAWQDAS